MRQFRTSGSVRGAAREGGPYRDTISDSIPAPRRQQADRVILFPSPFSEGTYALSSEQQAWHGSPRKISLKRFYKFALFVKDVTFVLYGIVNHAK